jgi:hypothetical protein
VHHHGPVSSKNLRILCSAHKKDKLGEELLRGTKRQSWSTKRQACEELLRGTKRQSWNTKKQAPIECWTEHGKGVYHRFLEAQKDKLE